MATTPPEREGAYQRRGKHMSANAASPTTLRTDARTYTAVGMRAGTPRYKSNREQLTMSLPRIDNVSPGVGVSMPTDTEAPRPIGVDPSETGSFRRLEVGEGAVVTSRENSALGRTAAFEALRTDETRMKVGDRPKVKSRQTPINSHRKLYAVLTIVTIFIIVVGIYFTQRLIVFHSKDVGSEALVEKTQVGIGEGITYGGGTYMLNKKNNGTYALTFQAEGSDQQQQIVKLSGTPVGLVLYKYSGALIIPENQDGSWDLMSYTPGSESVASQVVDANGKDVTGTGTIASVSLEGSILHVTTVDGSVTDVELW